ncbi:hypothetical protein Tco_1512269, partial [Tanacetum coccineum]
GRNPKVNKSKLGSKYAFLWTCCLLSSTDSHKSFLSTCITSYGYCLEIVSSGWSFVSAIFGQMTYSIASPTHNSAGSYVMQGALFTYEMIPIISIGGSVSPEGFLLLVLLLVVIIVTVIVIVILIVVVDDVSLILKLSFEIVGISLGLVFLLGLLALAIVAVGASRAVAMPLAISC